MVQCTGQLIIPNPNRWWDFIGSDITLLVNGNVLEMVKVVRPECLFLKISWRSA